MTFRSGGAREELGSIGRALGDLGGTVQRGAAQVTSAVTEAHSALNQRIEALHGRLQLIQQGMQPAGTGEAIRRDIAELNARIEQWRAEAAEARAEAAETRRLHEPVLRQVLAEREGAESTPEESTSQASGPAEAGDVSEAVAGQASEPPAAAPRPVAAGVGDGGPTGRAPVGEDGPPPPSSGATGTSATDQQPSSDHLFLLLTAARVAHAELVCHRDLWAFVVEQSAPQRHFLVPGQVGESEDGTVRVRLSGRSLIAVLTALEQTSSRVGPADDHADWALAFATYQALAGHLRAAASSCQDGSAHRIVVTIDLRQGPPAPADATPDATPDGDHGDEPPATDGSDDDSPGAPPAADSGPDDGDRPEPSPHAPTE